MFFAACARRLASHHLCAVAGDSRHVLPVRIQKKKAWSIFCLNNSYAIYCDFLELEHLIITTNPNLA